MPFIHQNQPKNPLVIRQIKVVLFTVQERLGRINGEPDTPGALLVELFNEGDHFAPMLFNQVDARGGQDDL